jgi:hypothetical protein
VTSTIATALFGVQPFDDDWREEIRMTDHADYLARKSVERFCEALSDDELIGFQHSERFREVSARYPRRVAEAYEGDLLAAGADDDVTVAERVASWEGAHGIEPQD